jgi:hypothetical protein
VAVAEAVVLAAQAIEVNPLVLFATTIIDKLPNKWQQPNDMGDRNLHHTDLRRVMNSYFSEVQLIYFTWFKAYNKKLSCLHTICSSDFAWFKHRAKKTPCLHTIFSGNSSTV